jgi:hypothetical protein
MSSYRRRNPARRTPTRCGGSLNSRDDSAKRELMVLALESLRPLDKRSTIFWDEE